MARITHLLGKRHMGTLALLGFFCLCMAGKTEFSIFCQKHFRVFGGMGGMTRQTALSSGHRCMGEGDLFTLVGMTAKAELVSLISEKFRAL
jgi:hypothetical protein